MFTLAHISDPHLGPLPAFGPADLLNKRFFGYLSWMRRRRKTHRPEVLDLLARDLEAQNPDHLAVTGDLVNIALAGEFERAAAWLGRLGPPGQVTVVPGNHDAYVAMPWPRSIGLWDQYMTGDDGRTGFPFVRRFGKIALIGLNSACPTPIAFATGALGAAQVERLEDELGRLGDEGAFRVVLLHHPPQIGAASWRKRLVDAALFRGAVARAGAELVLHGHNHTFAVAQIGAGKLGVPVFGVPSASAIETGRKPRAHYQLYDIEEGENGWRFDVRVRGLDADATRFVGVG